MISVDKIFKIFKKNKIELFTGVPDSVLKETKIKFDKMKLNSHFITSNEGSAVALAIGHHLATKKIACVYMQNSGLGNAINPLISIAHKKVYSIPMLLLIGWRGSPGIKDEPQHEVKGSITTKILKFNRTSLEFSSAAAKGGPSTGWFSTGAMGGKQGTIWP